MAEPRLPFERRAKRVYRDGTPLSAQLFKKLSSTVPRIGSMDRAPLIGRRIDMSIRPRALNSAIESPSGEFLTAHHEESGAGKGAGYVEDRRRTEEKMGYSQEFGSEGRPVYGFVTGPRLRRRTDDNTHGYGEEKVTFKRKVNRRASFTLGDSNKNAGLLRTRPVSRFRSGVKDLPSNADRGRLYDPRSTAEYVEAQIHGGADLSDVKHITVPTKERAIELQQKLAATGRGHIKVRVAKQGSQAAYNRQKAISKLRYETGQKLLGTANAISRSAGNRRSRQIERFEASPQGKAYRAAADKAWQERQSRLE
jgi:hypothetical protein